MRFTLTTTTVLFLALVALGVVAMSMTPMTSRTIYMMVLPSMLVFGLISLAIGVKYGEHRARAR